MLYTSWWVDIDMAISSRAKPGYRRPGTKQNNNRRNPSSPSSGSGSSVSRSHGNSITDYFAALRNSPGASRNTPSRTVSNAGSKRALTRSGQSVTNYFAALRSGSGSRSPGNSRNTPDRTVTSSTPSRTSGRRTQTAPHVQRHTAPISSGGSRSSSRSGSRTPGGSAPRSPGLSTPIRDRTRNDTPADSGGLIPSAYGYTQHGSDDGWSGTRNSDTHKLGLAHSRGPGNTAEQRADRQTDTNTRLHEPSADAAYGSHDSAYAPGGGKAVSDVAKTGQSMFSLLQNRIGSVVGGGAAFGLGGSTVTKDSGIDTVLGNVQDKIDSDIDDIMYVGDAVHGGLDFMYQTMRGAADSVSQGNLGSLDTKSYDNRLDLLAGGGAALLKDLQSKRGTDKTAGAWKDWSDSLGNTRADKDRSDKILDKLDAHTSDKMALDIAHDAGVSVLDAIKDSRGTDKTAGAWKEFSDKGISKDNVLVNKVSDIVGQTSDAIKDHPLTSKSSLVDNMVSGVGTGVAAAGAAMQEIIDNNSKLMAKIPAVTNSLAVGLGGSTDVKEWDKTLSDIMKTDGMTFSRGDIIKRDPSLIGPDQPHFDKLFLNNAVLGIDIENPKTRDHVGDLAASAHGAGAVFTDLLQTGIMAYKGFAEGPESANEHWDKYMGHSLLEFGMHQAVGLSTGEDMTEINKKQDKFLSDHDRVGGSVAGELLFAAGTGGQSLILKPMLQLGAKALAKYGVKGLLTGDAKPVVEGAKTIETVKTTIFDSSLIKQAQQMLGQAVSILPELSTASRRIAVTKGSDEAVIFEGNFVKGADRSSEITVNVLRHGNAAEPTNKILLQADKGMKLDGFDKLKNVPGGISGNFEHVARDFAGNAKPTPKVTKGTDQSKLISVGDTAEDMAVQSEIVNLARKPTQVDLAKNRGSDFWMNTGQVTEKLLENIKSGAVESGTKVTHIVDTYKQTLADALHWSNKSITDDALKLPTDIINKMAIGQTGRHLVDDVTKNTGRTPSGKNSHQTLNDILGASKTVKPDDEIADLAKAAKSADGSTGPTTITKNRDHVPTPTPKPGGGGGGTVLENWLNYGKQGGPGIIKPGATDGFGLGHWIGIGGATITGPVGGSGLDTDTGSGLNTGVIPENQGESIIDDVIPVQGEDLGQVHVPALGEKTVPVFGTDHSWRFDTDTSTKTTPITDVITSLRTSQRQKTIQDPIVVPEIPIIPIPIIPIIPTPYAPLLDDDLIPKERLKSKRKTVGYANNTFKDSFLGFADRSIITYGKTAKQASIGKNPKISLIKTQNIPDINKFKPHSGTNKFVPTAGTKFKPQSKSTSFVPAASNKSAPSNLVSDVLNKFKPQSKSTSFVPAASNKSAPSNLVSDVLNKFKPQSGKSMKFKAAVSKFVPIPSVNKFKPQSGKSMKFKPAVSKLPDYTKGFNPKSAKKGMAKNRLMKF